MSSRIKSGSAKAAAYGIKAIIFDWGRTLFDSETKREFDEAKSLIQFCHDEGIRLGLASLVSKHANAGLDERRRQIETSHLRKYFDVVRVTAIDKFQILDDIVAALGFRPEEILIVDDRMIRGIKYGNLHGHPTLWLRRGKFENELPNADTLEPTFTATSLEEVQKIIKSLIQVKK